MSALQSIIDNMNFKADLFGGAQISMPLDISEIERIADFIGVALSPENLTCDGAASPAHITQQVELLTTAQGELAVELLTVAMELELDK